MPLTAKQQMFVNITEVEIETVCRRVTTSVMINGNVGKYDRLVCTDSVKQQEWPTI